MASPLVIFAAGMGTAALSLGLGYATLYVPDGSQPSKTQIILANRPEPPPPTVEKVKREPRPVVAAMEPPAAPTVTSRETTGTGNGWVKEAHQTAETPKAPAAPTVPHVGPAAAPVAPPPGAAPPVAAAPAQPVTADMRPASVQAPVKVEQNKPTQFATPPQFATTERMDRKRERTARVREEDVEWHFGIDHRRGQRPILVERWRERVVDDPRARREVTILEPRRRMVVREEEPRPNDFFGMIFGRGL